jgi:Zn-dependent protease
LLPLWSLDGARGFRALSRSQRWIAVAVLTAAWVVSKEGLLILLVIMASIRAFASDAAQTPDRRALLQYACLVIVLAALCMVHAYHLEGAMGKGING